MYFENGCSWIGNAIAKSAYLVNRAIAGGGGSNAESVELGV